jgi:hypothetical protein
MTMSVLLGRRHSQEVEVVKAETEAGTQKNVIPPWNLCDCIVRAVVSTRKSDNVQENLRQPPGTHCQRIFRIYLLNAGVDGMLRVRMCRGVLSSTSR